MQRFRPGDHLKVRRTLGYFHHGIYVSDNRVIQFGGGKRFADKVGAKINAVSIDRFEKGGRAEVARHDRSSPFTGYHPPADARWKIVERAEFMLKLQPRLSYNLIGHNCEHIANMCVSGTWIESYQIRRLFVAITLMSLALSRYVSRRTRKRLPLPGWVTAAVFGGPLVRVSVKTTYDLQIKKFWQEIGEAWLAHEQELEERPPSGLNYSG